MSELIKEILFKLKLLPFAKKLLHKPMLSYQRYLFSRSAVDSIKLINESIKESKVQVWLEFGTLLGAFRDKEVIRHDTDLDFGVLATEDFTPLEDALLKRGFVKKRSIELKATQKLVEITYSYKGANVDFFFAHVDSSGDFLFYDFESAKGLTWRETMKQHGGLIPFETKISSFKLKSYPFYNLNFLIPTSTEAHLIELYGADYSIPNPAWKLSSRPSRKQISDVGKVFS